jgi:hypothetical protein
MAKINANTKVYSATAWWRDSDPSMQVVALTSKKAQEEIDRMMVDQAQDVFDMSEPEDHETVDEILDEIAWSGVHAFSLGDLASKRELANAIRDLEDIGVWYPER